MDAIILRASGLDNLTAARAYFHQDLTEALTNQFFFLHLRNCGISVGQFYTWNVLGVSPEVLTANVPTICIWGTLYILGGVIAVFMGLFFAGALSKMLYLALLANMRRDGRWIVLCTILITTIFHRTIFEGMSLQFPKSLLAAVAICSAFILILNIFSSRLHTYEVDPS